MLLDRICQRACIRISCRYIPVIVTKQQLVQIIKEELEIISEAPISFTKVFSILDNSVKGGKIISNSAIDGLVKAGTNLATEEVQERAYSKLLGLSGLEAGLIGLAIGIPMIFFSEYKSSQRGDNMARYMSKLVKRPIEMKDLLDPRNPANHEKIISQGGRLENNPIIYLANKENTNVAAQLFKDKVIASDVFKVIQEIHRKKIRAIKKLEDLKNQSASRSQV